MHTNSNLKMQNNLKAFEHPHPECLVRGKWFEYGEFECNHTVKDVHLNVVYACSALASNVLK